MQRNTIVNERTSQEGAHLVVAVAPASTSAQVDGGEKGVLDVDGAADAAVLRVAVIRDTLARRLIARRGRSWWQLGCSSLGSRVGVCIAPPRVQRK